MEFEKLTRKQIKGWDILTSKKYSEILFDGGSRSGKTLLILIFFIICCLLYPGIRFLCARLRFNHAKASIWLQELIPLLETNFPKNIYSINKQDFIVKFSNNSEIWIGGLDEKDRTDKILGQEYAAIFLNESVQISMTTRDTVKSRLAQKIKNFHNFIIYDCNPRHPAHYLYQEFYIEKDSNKAKLHWMPEDNIENLPEGYIKLLDGLKGNKKKRFRYGQWVQIEGAVYKNVDANNIIECDPDFGKYDGIVLGQDWGYYSATNIWGIKDDNAHCLFEINVVGGKTSDIIEKLEEIEEIYYIKKKSYSIYCDHEPDRIQELCDAGYNALKAYKEVGAGDSSVNEFNLFFDIHCQNTFQSMLNLVHQQDINNHYTTNHIKENDHFADGGRYALHGWRKDNKMIDFYFMDDLI